MKQVFVICVCALATSLMAAGPSPLTKGFQTGPLKLKAMGNLTFGPEGILFVGDSIGSSVAAIDLQDTTPGKVAGPTEIIDIETKIGSMLGVDAKDVMIHDMAANPISQNVYLSVSRGRAKWTNRWQLPNDVANPTLLIKVNPKGEMSEVKLDKVSHATIALANPVSDDAEHPWKKTKLRVDTISHMAYGDGKLYVAGLSNEEFASTMRVIPFPFEGDAKAASLEIYHGAHGAYETNSPVRAFIPYQVNGKSHLLAAYLCTPLVTFPTNELADKQHIKGRTIAELGFGNYPLDMVPYKKNGKDYVLIINSTRGVMRIAAEDINNYKGSITTKAGAREGVSYDTLPTFGVMQADTLSDEFLVALVRAHSGSLNMAVFPTRRL